MNKFYHIRIYTTEKKHETIYNLTEEELLAKIVNPYKKGDCFFINGMSILSLDIHRILIKYSKETIDKIAERLKYEDDYKRRKSQQNGVWDLSSFDSKNAAFHKSEDILNEFIQGPAGYEKEILQEVQEVNDRTISNKIIFDLNRKHLETILKNTEYIINQLNLKPKSEASVYNAVKHVIFSIFFKSKNAGSNFLKISKEFKPDILVPEAKSAVEYKYAKDETKLKATIEQIAADAKGYTGDSEYEYFYAVFYVTKDFWGENRFYEAWKEFNFPENWIPIYIKGKE